MRSFIFKAELEQDSDGRWSAGIDTLPGCATWGFTQKQALDALRDAAQAYIEVLLEKGAGVQKDEPRAAGRWPYPTTVGSGQDAGDAGIRPCFFV